MAIPRVFDPSAPFIVTASGSDLSLAGQESEDGGQVSDMQKKSLVRVVAPDISRAMQHGTATHMAAQYKDDLCVSIVAQAEREDFQEFSPTNTHSCFSRVLKTCSTDLSDTEDEDFAGVARLPHYHLQRKQRRKARTRWSPQEEERPIIRGLWVQEIDWLRSADRETIIPPPPEFTDLAPNPHSHMVCECCGGRTEGRHGWSVTNDSSDNRGGSDSDCGTNSICTQDSDSDSSCCKEDTMLDSFGGGVSNLTLDLMKVSGFSLARMPLCTTDDRNHIEAALGFLRGKVTQMPKVFLPPFFKDLNNWRSSKHTNEGFIFHSELQPNRCQYREGDDYSILHHIQNGSYGDVFCIRDMRTGFRCAAKKIPLSHFSGEEVSTWSALNSPRVVELFGAVREGLNVVLFMDLKPACLAQLLKEMKSLPEDLALHFLHQTLGALKHLHQRRVLHLDVKVDNVLLSADCRDTFLCDFGLSETLNDSGWSIKAFRGAALPGTETHMAPEVARGDQLSAKVDVWSSCCMLLHMLNGCHPWIRYYAHPLCLHIVNEPPPLWEVPSNCNNFTAKVFSAGLQKDADKRASAQELRRKTTKAIRAVGGLSSRSISMAYEKLYHRQPGLDPVKPKAVANSTPAMYWVSPWRTMAVEEDSSEDRDSDQVFEVETDSVNGERESKPGSLRDDWDWDSDSDSEVDIYMGEEEYMQEKWLKTDKAYEGDWEEEWDNEEEDDDEEEEEGWDSDYYHALKGLFPLLQKGQQHTKITSWGSGPELEYLRDGGAVGTTVNTPSPEPRDDPPSCFSCSEISPLDGSEGDSDHSSDDLSSGVFSSCNSHTEASLQWLPSGAANPPSSNCFEGVDIWIENVQGVCLRIRERRLVKVGHVAIGISDQIGKAFTLETLDRKTVPFDQEIKESCLWLRCVPAPDRCQRWKWRVQDGKLELRE